MKDYFPLLSGFGPWNWFFLAVGLFILDAIVPGVHFLWFRGAAIVVGVLSLSTGITWQWQIVSFGIISVIAVLWMRRYVGAGAIESDLPDLNMRGRQYIGRLVVVEEAIECGRGKVRIGDTVWIAVGPDAKVGTSMKVTGAHETALVVEQPTSG